MGFTVSQTVPRDERFELQEDGRLQVALLGATTLAVIQTTAVVDREFSLDPGTGTTRIRGEVVSCLAAGRAFSMATWWWGMRSDSG